MDEVIEMLENLISGKADALDFSIAFPDKLIEKYDEMYSTNQKFTIEINDIMPDICDVMEPGMEPTRFIAAVKEEYERVKSYL